ncbi:MAG: hypothetical protein AABW59_02220 [archaeon]
MVNMTLAVPEEMYAKMKKYPEIKWTQVMRSAAVQKLEALEAEGRAWREHAQKHAVKRGWSEAHEIFKF